MANIFGTLNPKGIVGGSETSGCYILENASSMTHLYAYTYEGLLRDIDNKNNFPLKGGDILIGDDNYAYSLTGVDEDLGTFTAVQFWKLDSPTPTIEIDFSQALSSDTYALDSDQFGLIQNNEVVKVDLYSESELLTFIKKSDDGSNIVMGTIITYDSTNSVYVYKEAVINVSSYEMTITDMTLSSGGGSIPTITIAAAQQDTSLLPDIVYELTQEQINIFENNNLIYVELPNEQNLIYTKYEDGDTQQYNIGLFQNLSSQADANGNYIKAIQLLFVSNAITYSFKEYRESKQLYQHNIRFIYTGSYGIGGLKLDTIITDSNTPFTYATLFNYLKGYDLIGAYLGKKLFGANGYHVYSGSYKTFIGLCLSPGDTDIYAMYMTSGGITGDSLSSGYDVDDVVIPL